MSLVGKALGQRTIRLLFPLHSDGTAGAKVKKRLLTDDAPDIEVGAIWRFEAAPQDRLRPIEELAAPNSARADLWAVAKRFETDPRYPDAVLSEADRLEQDPGFDAPDLVDQRDLDYITIDNEDSRDLDQAMYIRRAATERGEPEGGYVVYYALADAAFYVDRDSKLFGEALARGASYYFPGFAVPMLPPSLSEGLVSLNPDVDRRALVFEMVLDTKALPVTTNVFQAVIHSRAKLAYNGVQDFYDAPERSPLSGKTFTETLELLAEVGKLRIADAERRNVVRYNRIGMSVGFTNERGARFRAFAEIRNDCEKYNEQVSLLCNIEGARLLLAKSAHPELQPVFRVHPSPPPERLDQLSDLIEAIARAHRRPLETWAWRRDSGESLADYILRLPRGGDDLGLARAIERAALLTNLRSTFEAEPGAHYGVGAEIYARFSSPMREIVGIFTHRELLDIMGKAAGSDIQEIAEDAELRDAVLKAANESKFRQKRITNECNKLVLDHLFKEDLRRSFKKRPAREGTILGIRQDRLYVQLDAPPMEVKLYSGDIAQVTDAKPERTRDRATMVGTHKNREVRWRLGDPIRVKVLGYQQRKRRWMLVPAMDA